MAKTSKTSVKTASDKSDSPVVDTVTVASVAPTPDNPLHIDGSPPLQPDEYRTSLNQPPPINRDDDIRAASAAEIGRQVDVAEAVKDANEHDLPKLGGPQMNPGNPELDEGKG